MAQATNKEETGFKHRRLSSVSSYEDFLVEMIVERRKVFDKFLTPAVMACAETWAMLRKVQKNLMEKKQLTLSITGSQGQEKVIVDALLPYYLKLQAELRLQFQALGLNWNATPSKIKDSVQDEVDAEKDQLTSLLVSAKQATTEIPE